ncbi:MAG TPA: hypothetical protein VN616_13200, partial [Puia sp.]|nr:hypothetical protein [Puia sp.]
MKPTLLISGALFRALPALLVSAKLTRASHALLLSAALLSATGVGAQYKPVDEGSSVQFTVDNFGFAVTGSFTGLQGAIDFDPQNAGLSRFEVS